MMKIQVEFDEEDLRKAVVAYLKLNNNKVCLPQNVYFRIQKEEGYSDRIFCTATVHSWG